MADDETPWQVYRIRNFTRNEIYFGMAQDAEGRMRDEHMKGKTKAIEHWDWKEDVWKWLPLSTYPNERQASAIVRSLERETPPEQWTHIRTSGD